MLKIHIIIRNFQKYKYYTLLKDTEKFEYNMSFILVIANKGYKNFMVFWVKRVGLESSSDRFMAVKSRPKPVPY